jgi:hypothetical protein
VTTRITMLDDEQLAAMAPHAREWVGRALRTERFEWSHWETAVRACYQYGGVAWPGVAVRVTSPLALARALFLARIREVPGDEDRALDGLVRRLTHRRADRAINRQFDRTVLAQVRRAVFDPVDAAAGELAVAHAVGRALVERPLMQDPAGVRESAHAAARRITRGRLLHGSRPVPGDWRAWTLHLSGQGASAWSAYATFLAGVHPDEGHRGWRRRIEAFTGAQSAGWWWPHMDFVLVSDRPSDVRTETTPDGSVRLHSDRGPALTWSDGWSLHLWHGTLVPAWVVEAPTVQAIHNESNVEVRRCGIESLGWDAYIAGAGLRLVDRADDPGNPDCRLSLYDLPASVWGSRTRVLLATNGSPERDGTRRRYGLPVPADMDTAVNAAAWTYGLDADQYARLARRT